MMNELSIKIKNYACFGEEPQGFDSIKPINIVIGKNNSGKSRLLDIFDILKKSRRWVRGSEIIISYPLEELAFIADLTKALAACQIKVRTSDTSTFTESGDAFLKRYLLIRNIVLSNKGDQFEFYNFEPPLEFECKLDGANITQYFRGIHRRYINPIHDNSFVVLRAERDIKPEDVKDRRDLDSSGNGATNIIRQYKLNAMYNNKIVDEILLTELNKIVEPENRFTSISLKSISDHTWEIYLGEADKNDLVPLSSSGSGLKTLLLVLINTIIVPQILNEEHGIQYNNIIFAFEELENNLHPSLQRKLYQYIRNLAENNNATFFLTTHSSIAIDQFSNDPLAQIYHIIHNGKGAVSKPVYTYAEGELVLDDLGVRASDILQSNGVIWVEGPSDRIYINKWIDIWSNSTLHENVHYQCVFYGGATLDHLSAETSRDSEDLIKIFTLNRNAIIVMDSDKKSEEEDLKETKKRIVNEIGENGIGICWITQGREIENYISAAAISNLIRTADVKKDVGQYDSFTEYLDGIKPGLGENYKNNKVRYSKELRNHLTKENCNRLDLEEKMNEIIMEIKRWNSLD